MEIKRLTSKLGVGPQIRGSDVERLAALGFRSIIGNRPDAESADQPEFSAIAASARKAGLEVRHIPVISGAITPSDINEFRDALRELPNPVFAFCRTGTRSTLLWALANPDAMTASDRIRIAAENGYDISALGPRLSAAENGAARDG
ncbi:MAG TPA: TIGR01244 family sulfur transferase [Sphingomicrobium sp.]|nr:TIGR01244 family sulfur transferase [Sphingomicrobium sp.]